MCICVMCLCVMCLFWNGKHVLQKEKGYFALNCMLTSEIIAKSILQIADYTRLDLFLRMSITLFMDTIGVTGLICLVIELRLCSSDSLNQGFVHPSGLK